MCSREAARSIGDGPPVLFLGFLKAFSSKPFETFCVSVYAEHLVMFSIPLRHLMNFHRLAYSPDIFGDHIHHLKKRLRYCFPASHS